MKCNICGKSNPNDARFCSDCAAPLHMEPEVDHQEEKLEAENFEADKFEVDKFEAEKREAEKFEVEKFEAEEAEGKSAEWAPGQTTPGFIPEVRKRTVQEHARNVLFTTSVIVAIIVVSFLAFQFFKSVGDKIVLDYVSAANKGDVDTLLHLSVPEDFYEYTNAMYGVDRGGYREMMEDYYTQRKSLYEINRIVKLIPDKTLIEDIRDVYEEDWDVVRKDIQEIELYEIEVTQYDPGYEPDTNTFQIPIVKYRGKWYVYIWKFYEHEVIREEMQKLKGME